MAEFLVSWGPMLLLIGVWLYVARKGGTLQYKKYVEEMKNLALAQIEEQKTTNAALARIEELLRAQQSK